MKTTEIDGKAYVEKDGNIFEIVTDKNEDITGLNFKEKGTITQPRIHKVEVIEKTEDTVTIKADGLRMDGGKYYYYISESKENYGESVGNSDDGINTFNIPQKDKEYYIKVVGKNVQGEESSKIIKIRI